MVAPSGWGLGCYHKESDGSDLSRKRIVLATFAGYFDEKRFCDERSYEISDPESWYINNDDGREARTLLSEMSPENLSGGSLSATYLELLEIVLT